MSKPTENLDGIAERIRTTLASKDAAREKALPLCRDVIRASSQAIRAIHRREFDSARALLSSARDLSRQAQQALMSGGEPTSISFLRDSQKEFAEGSITLALVTGDPIPAPEELQVDFAAYLNGLGEAVGELRRYVLDGVRKGDLSRAEELLTFMDDIYIVLVTMDFPDAITGGLRHTTDMVRGVLERTRSDLTLIMTQKDLEKKLEEREGAR